MSGPRQTRAFVLHQRPYRESSAIVEFLAEQGRVSAVCRGMRSSSRSAMALRANMQPFAELSLSYSGKTELKTLRSVESLHVAPAFARDTLYAALYLNELLLRLGHGNEFCSSIYSCYQHTLRKLQSLGSAAASTETATSTDKTGHTGQPSRAAALETALRSFELAIIDTMGFAPDFSMTCDTQESIVAGEQYCYLHGQGFCSRVPRGELQGVAEAQPAGRESRPLLVGGEVLQAVAEGDLANDEVRRFAKQLTRRLLQPLLGDRPLKTRELYG